MFDFSLSSVLSTEIITLLNAIDNFAYPVFESPYQSLGDLHDILDRVEIRNDAGTKKYIVQMTLGEIKSLINEWEKYNNQIIEHNRHIYVQMDACQNDSERYNLYSKLIPETNYKNTWPLEKKLKDYQGNPDTTEVDVDFTYQLYGFYSRTTTMPTKGYVVLKRLGNSRQDMLSLATTYVHEMMHAYYDANLSASMNDAEYAEEPLAEYGMLRFVRAFVRVNPQYNDMLQFAIEKVAGKQQSPGIFHYGFGEYLYQKYSHLEWENLMRKAHSKIDITRSPYTDLKDVLCGKYPSLSQLPNVAQLLYDTLTAAIGLPHEAISMPSAAKNVRLKSTTKTLTSPKMTTPTLPSKPTTSVARTIKPLTSHQTNTILDNSDSFCIAEYLKAVLSDAECTEMKIATGYFDLPGLKIVYNEMKSFLERGGRLQLLLGEEPAVRSYQLDPNQRPAKDTNFPGFYLRRDIGRLNEDFEQVAQLLLDYTDDEDESKSQIQIHVYGKDGDARFLHAKCYIALGKGFAKGIIGSSNFTEKGLLENAELNYLETHTLVVTAPDNPYANTKSHLTWFTEKWDDSLPWNGQFIDILTTSPIISKELTPYEVYIRLLQDYFGTDDTMDDVIEDYLDKAGYDKYAYQVDAIKRCYQLLHKMHGFLLADVVGLGKTIVGASVIRYYLEHDKKADGTLNRVLIIAPPSIMKGWQDTINAMDSIQNFKMNDCIDILSIGKMAGLVNEDNTEDDTDENEEIKINNKEYGLIVLDESHRFRNGNGTAMYDSLMNAITGMSVRPYIGLISATPQNNRPIELWHQLAFMVETPNRSQFPRIPGRNIQKYFVDIESQYKAAKQTKNTSEIINISSDIRDKVLNDIIVRRTRTDILKYYPTCSIEFPTTFGPNVLQYDMPSPLDQLFSDTVDAITKDIKYHRYSAIARLVDKANKNRYEHRANMTVARVSEQLADMMRMLLVKRLESSFDAFVESLESLHQKTQYMIDMWNDDKIYICPSFDVNKVLAESATLIMAYSKLDNKISSLPTSKNIYGQNRRYKQSDFDAAYITDLQNDLKIIDALLARWKTNTTDPKLDTFISHLPLLMGSDYNRLNSAIAELRKTYPNESSVQEIIDEWTRLLPTMAKTAPTKLVIFTEAKKTLDILKQACEANGYMGRILTVTSQERAQLTSTIQENFDAKFKGVWKDDYDILISTEVLSEGINLHRANVILNYDSPWNAAKLIQRIGRVNRIGSPSNAVFVYNFFPSINGDTIIGLTANAYAKLQSFHILFGEDGKIFDPHEVLSPVSFAQTVNGSASPEMTYLADLKEYKKNYKNRFNRLQNATIPIRVALPQTDIVETSKQQPNTICAVKDATTTMSSYFLVDAANKCYEISPLEMMQWCKCSVDAAAIKLPFDLDKIESKACTEYKGNKAQRTKRGGNQNAKLTKSQSQAQNILANIWANDGRFQSYYLALRKIRTAVNAGAKKTIDAVIATNEKLSPTTTQQEVEELLKAIPLPTQVVQASIYDSEYNFITMNKQ